MDSRYPSTIDDFEIWRGSDRAAGILAGALVDRNLLSALRKKVPTSAKLASAIYSFGAPAGTFGARIDLGHLIGLYSEPSWRDLKLIAKVRNAFAHEPEARAFSLDHIASRCAEISTVDRVVFEIGDYREGVPAALFVDDIDSARRSPRLRYIYSCAFFWRQFEVWGEHGTPVPRHDPPF